MMHQNTTIGYIGLGLMGQAMAQHLLNANYAIHVHTRNPDKATHLIDQGAIWQPSCAALARAVGDGIIIICVTDTSALQTVINGDTGLIQGLAKNALIIDMGTSQVDITREIASAVTARGVLYVDAPVSGGEKGAKTANLSIMAGGDTAAMARARPILQCLSNKITHVGPIGAGQVAKTANQMIVGTTLAIVSEAMTLAQTAGADLAQVREALLGGFADSALLRLHGKKMIDGDFVPGGRARTQSKDLTEAQALAHSMNLNLPVTNTTQQQWQQMVDDGHGDLDQAGIYYWMNQAQANNTNKSTS